MKVNWQHNTPLQKQGLKIVKLLQQGGFKAFWVGGTVRDLFLKRANTDLDIATSAKPDQTESILAAAGIITKPVGKKFGTILAVTKSSPIEITTFRKEGEYVLRRKPSLVTYITSLEEDSQRRDFTINALYYDPISKIVYDPQSGLKDIQRKLIKFVGNPKLRIDEDALRMMRAVRFHAQLNFKLEKNTFAAIKTRAKYIQQISGERIKRELDKILIVKNKVEGIRLLDELGILKFIAPEVSALKNVLHKSKHYHLEGNVFEHMLLVLKNSPDNNLVAAYSALFHDAGKSSTAVPKLKPEGVVNSFPNHENVSSEIYKKFAQTYVSPKAERNQVLWITKMHMTRNSFVKDMKSHTKTQILLHPYFCEMLSLWRADALGNLRLVDGKLMPGEPIAYKLAIKILKTYKMRAKLIKKFTDGKFLQSKYKIKSGPQLGNIIHKITTKIIFDEIKNISDLNKFLLYKNT